MFCRITVGFCDCWWVTAMLVWSNRRKDLVIRRHPVHCETSWRQRRNVWRSRQSRQWIGCRVYDDHPIVDKGIVVGLMSVCKRRVLWLTFVKVHVRVRFVMRQVLIAIHNGRDTVVQRQYGSCVTRIVHIVHATLNRVVGNVGRVFSWRIERNFRVRQVTAFIEQWVNVIAAWRTDRSMVVVVVGDNYYGMRWSGTFIAVVNRIWSTKGMSSVNNQNLTQKQNSLHCPRCLGSPKKAW